jgi:hypothetical protein
MTSDSTVPCPVCWQQVGQSKGYLAAHEAPIVRGTIVTGRQFCDGSNQKPDWDLKTVTFSGQCIECLLTTTQSVTEEYPGSLAVEGGVFEVSCKHCTVKGGTYCDTCDEELREVIDAAPDTDKWISVWGNRDDLCDGSDLQAGKIVHHTPVVREARTVLVLVTDNHVIEEPEDEELVTHF